MDNRLAELDGLSTWTVDEDPIHIPGTSVKVEWDVVTISSDDGNESSWGSEKWGKVGENMVLLYAEGRDCFDNNLGDQIYFSKPEDVQDALDEETEKILTEGGYEHYILPKGYKVPIDKFVELVKKYVDYWQGRREAALSGR